MGQDAWYLCHGPSFHYGLALAGSTIVTHQQDCEMFAGEAELEARIDELKGVGWYQDNKPIAEPESPVSNVT